MSGTSIYRNKILVVLALVACAALSARWLPAQDTAGSTAPSAASAAAADAAKPMGSKSLFAILKSGGLMMIPLFGCSFLTLVFVFERAISLRSGRVIPRPFVKRFLHQVHEGKLDRDGALALCDESSSPMVDVFAAMVRKWGRPSVEIEQAIIDAEDRVAPGLRRYLRVFSGVATISPLLGLIGTVFGMIRLFDAISGADAMGRTEMLAAGISEALFTTAGGLLIAIPALCFHLYFQGRVERLVIAIDEVAQELASMISAEAIHDDRRIRTKGRPPAAA
jgi:biopolymer transport protein ExbB